MGSSPNRNCIFVGAPGSGKGTQAKKIQEFLRIPHISTGDILRAEVSQGTALGLEVKEILAAGKLVNDELMLKIIKSRFQKSDVGLGFILDGYPRNLSQAKSLSQVFAELKIKDPIVFFFDVPKSLLVSRLTGRLSCSKCGSVFHSEFNRPRVANVCDNCGASSLVQRADDNEETAVRRLDVFESQTRPMLDFYQDSKQLQQLDGGASLEAVTDKILKALK
jgi:adenylate kinase